MAIDTKLNTVENGISGIRDAIQNINSNMGKGHINTLDDDIEKLSNQNNYIHYVTINPTILKSLNSDDVTIEDYSNLGSTKTRGVIAIPLKDGYKCAASFTINENSPLQYGTGTMSNTPTPGIDINWIETSGWITSGSKTNTYSITSNTKYLYLIATYINGNTGIPTFEEFISNITFSLIVYSKDGENIEYEYVGPNYTTISVNNFINNQDIKSIMIPDTVVTISSSVFQGCNNLSNINLENIKTVNSTAFRNGFKNVDVVVNMPNLTNMKYGVFYESSIIKVENLGKITSIPNRWTIYDVTMGTFSGCKKLESVVLPDTLRTIGSDAFKNCTNLKSINFPTSITTINISAFENCTNLEIDLNLPNLTTMTGERVFKNSGITSISSLGHISTMYYSPESNGPFQGCTKLTEVTLPNELIDVNGPWFRDCTLLTTLHWNSNNVTRVNRTFWNTRLEIEDLSLPSLTYLGPWSFSDTRIKKVSNLGSITTLDESSGSYNSSPFYNCRLLEEITLPATFTNFKRRSFKNCISLNKVIMLCTTPPTTVATISYMFEGATAAYNACKFYVPYSEDHSILTAYQTATNWSAVASRIFELNPDGSIPT